MTTFKDLEESYLSELITVEDWAEDNGLMSSNQEVTDSFRYGILPDIIANLPTETLVDLITHNKEFEEAKYYFNDYVDDLVRSGLLHEVQAKSYTYEGE